MQEKLDLMIEAYGALLDDWRYGLTGEHSALTDANLEAYGYDKQAGWFVLHPFWQQAVLTHRNLTRGLELEVRG